MGRAKQTGKLHQRRQMSSFSSGGFFIFASAGNVEDDDSVYDAGVNGAHDWRLDGARGGEGGVGDDAAASVRGT